MSYLLRIRKLPKFGNWYVINPQSSLNRWLCQCEKCRRKKWIGVNILKEGTFENCDHLGNDQHGMSKTKTYRIWASMVSRGSNSRSTRADRYYHKGVRVCKRWRKFVNFLEDMGECPKGMSIERKDNNKGYEPDNCKWATRSEQMLNVDYRGVKPKTGVNKSCIVCNKEFYVQKSKIDKRFCCSKQCKDISLRNPDKKPCLNCNGFVSSGRTKFCCVSCEISYNDKKVIPNDNPKKRYHREYNKKKRKNRSI